MTSECDREAPYRNAMAWNRAEVPQERNIYIYIYIWGPRWLRCCATNRKVVGSIPAGVIGIFH